MHVPGKQKIQVMCNRPAETTVNKDESMLAILLQIIPSKEKVFP